MPRHWSGASIHTSCPECPQHMLRMGKPCPGNGSAAPPRGSTGSCCRMCPTPALTPPLIPCQLPRTFLPLASRLFPGCSCGGVRMVPRCTQPAVSVPCTAHILRCCLHDRGDALCSSLFPLPRSTLPPSRVSAFPTRSPAQPPGSHPMEGVCWVSPVHSVQLGAGDGAGPVPPALIGALLNGGRSAGAVRRFATTSLWWGN